MHHDFVQHDLLGRAAHDAPAAAATAAQESHQASAPSETTGFGPWIASTTDSRNLANRIQQGPKARDVSEAGHTHKQLADRVTNTILHRSNMNQAIVSNMSQAMDRLAKLECIVSNMSQAMLCVVETQQQHLGADAAASAAQTETWTKLSASCAALAGHYSAHSADSAACF
jgi:hypothetical protein